MALSATIWGPNYWFVLFTIALNYSLKTFDHGKVLAFPHTTIKYWDLRYTVGEKIFIHDSNPTYPGPDLICSSGKIMRRSLISNGYPEKKLIDLLIK